MLAYQGLAVVAMERPSLIRGFEQPLCLDLSPLIVLFPVVTSPIAAVTLNSSILESYYLSWLWWFIYLPFFVYLFAELSWDLIWAGANGRTGEQWKKLLPHLWPRLGSECNLSLFAFYLCTYFFEVLFCSLIHITFDMVEDICNQLSYLFGEQVCFGF